MRNRMDVVDRAERDPAFKGLVQLLTAWLIDHPDYTPTELREAAMMAERRCGTCQYWQRHDGQEHRRDLATGDCAYPLPICLPAEYRITPYAKAGKDCPTWHPKVTE